ncbi:MAG: hypothetical protein EA352_04850 [Gemmatimonadales bacterium]|nr:MAG: hypothetical protein EA352_04850 [Gemmatimonadales bacterium]
MREFRDAEGNPWTADVVRRDGLDYQGRYSLVFRSPRETEELWVADIRWNSEKTARRTLETMSDVELRRRLRSGTGRRTAPDPEAGGTTLFPEDVFRDRLQDGRDAG